MRSDEARRMLEAHGVVLQEVELPGGPEVVLRQGALRLRKAPEGRVDVVADEAGLQEVLVRAADESEALDFVVNRLTAPLPVPRSIPEAQLHRGAAAWEQVLPRLRQALTSGPGLISTALWDGAIVDRFGTRDGFLLWPVETPFAQRSLPPSVLDDTDADLGLKTFGVARELPVRARLTGPGFGQPGGAVLFKIDAPGVTVRDLLRDGTLVDVVIDRP